jgi:hypothetical protein
VVQGDELEEAGHRQALALPALQGLERSGEDLRLVTESEADPELAPVDGQDAPGSRNRSGHRKSVNGKR